MSSGGGGGFDEDEARELWEDEGFDVDDFSVDAYLAWQKRNDKMARYLDHVRGVDRLEEKQEIIRRREARTITATKVVKFGAWAGQTLAEEGYAFGKEVATFFEPGFLRRIRRRKRYEQRIKAVEEEAYKIRLEKREAKDARKERTYEQKAVVTERVRGIAHAEPSQALLGNLRDTAEKDRKQADRDGFNARRQRILEERKAQVAAILAKRKAAAEAEAQKTRHWRIEHWGAEAKSRRAEAHELSNRTKDDRSMLDLGLQAEDKREDKQRVRDRSVDQVKGPSVSSETWGLTENLGVFGKPLDVGDFGAAHQGEPQEGVDELQVKVFSEAGQSAAHQDKYRELENVEMELGRSQQLYDALQQEAASMSDAAMNLLVQRGRLDAELGQLGEEHRGLLVVQQTRTDRKLTPAERQATHARKRREADLKARIEAIAHRVEVLQERRRASEQQSLGVARATAVLKVDAKAKKADLDAHNSGLGELPMVVGKHISDVEGGVGKLVGRPVETFNLVTHTSQLEVLRASAKSTLDAHRVARHMEHRSWVMNQQRLNQTAHLEGLLNRLATVNGAVKDGRAGNQRVDLVQAIELFFRRNEKLNVVNERHAGGLMWWRFQDPVLSKGAQQWVSNEGFDETGGPGAGGGSRGGSRNGGSRPTTAASGVSFGGDDDDGDGAAAGGPDPNLDENWQGAALGDGLFGYVMGEISLPKFDLYSISFAVSKRSPYLLKQGDSTDTVTVKLGPTLKNLVSVAVIKNVPNEYSGQIRYEVEHTLRTGKLAYRFEWNSQSDNVDEHMSVEAGRYVVKEVEPLETVAGSNRVVSSFVKMLRIEESQGKSREARWLTELIAAEESEDKEWDSSSLSGFKQRYTRTTFTKLLRQELVKMKEAEQAEEEKARRGAAPDDNDGDDSIVGGLSAGDIGKSKKEMARLERVQTSFENYITRKRERQQPTIDVAMAKVGMVIELFNFDMQKWEHATVQDCKVKWRDNGVRAEITHKLHKFDDFQQEVGKAFWADLTTLRYYLAQKKEVDEKALELWKQNNALHEQLQLEQDARDKIEAEAEAKRQADREAEDAAFKVKEEQELEEAKDRIRTAAKEALLRENTQKQLKTMARRATAEIKAGIGIDPADVPKKSRIPFRQAYRLKKLAMKMAHERFTADFCTEAMADERDKWESIAQDRADEMEEKIARERLQGVRAARTETKRKAMLDTEVSKHRAAKRDKLRSQLVIENFDQAIQKAAFCEHLRCKAWGDCYGKGVRCLECGKELMSTHEEQLQQCGIGSGDDPRLVHRVDRHRSNEAAYRFRTAGELSRVEAERLRLEKERRTLEETDTSFFDFDQISDVYEFDRRHKYYMKQNNVVRQGVQWGEDELAARRRELNDELQVMTPRSRTRRRAELLAWEAEAQAPTFRAADLRHEAQYRDTILRFARINNFRTRLWELKGSRVELLAERELRNGVLGLLHHDVFDYEVRLKRVEQDLGRAALVMQMRHVVQRQYSDAEEVRKLAHTDKCEKEMKCVGLVEDAEEAEALARECGNAVRDMLRQRVNQERMAHALMERVSFARTSANAKARKVKEMRERLDAMHYRQRGVIVLTPYGQCRVLLYREADSMVVVQMPFGEPKARMYLTLATVLQLERAVSQATVTAMEADEAATKAFYLHEKTAYESEARSMDVEEMSLRDKIRFDLEMKAEEDAVEKTVEKAIAGAHQFLKLSMGRGEIKNRVERNLEREIKQREIGIKSWRGVGKKPKRMRRLDREWYRMEQRRAERKLFLQEQAELAEGEARAAIEHKHNSRAMEATFEFVINHYLADFILDISDDAIRSGLDAKNRAEDETGIVFADPPHMQYELYNTLSRWWQTKKEILKSELETWGARSAQDEQRWEQERQERQALVRDVEEKERREVEKRRQDALCKNMAAEEAWSRRFYRDEMKMNLNERREMKKQEHEMKLFLKEEAIMAEAAKSKYRVATYGDEDVGPSAMERRRLELKQGKAEKNRLKRELEAMTAEDALSTAVRAEEKRLEQLASLKAEMELYGLDDGDVVDDDVSVDSYVSSAGESDGEGEAGDRDKAGGGEAGNAEGDAGEGGEAAAKKNELSKEEARAERRAARQRKRVEMSRARSQAKREAAEKQAAAELERARQQVLVEHAKVELEWMELEEEAKLVEKEVRVAQENQRKVTLYCQQKGQEEMRAKSVARQRRGLADKRMAAASTAATWLIKCTAQRDDALAMRKRVDKDTCFMDTKALTSVYARWTTDQLHSALHERYFRTLVMIVANRAELIATERRLMRVNELLLINEDETTTKTRNLDQAWKSFTRDELMRLRRSQLGLKMFGKWQARILHAVFQGWLKFFTWHRGHTRAFDLKYTLIKQELDLRKLYPDLSDKPAHRAVEIANSPTKPAKPTVLQQHTTRPVRCRHCFGFYLEVHNHAQSCAYHPGEYLVACPRWCKEQGASTKCMSHRTKRWTCCDLREKGENSSNGCSRRFHVAPSHDPEYKLTVERLEKEYQEDDARLEAELQPIRDRDWVREAGRVKKDQLDGIANELTGERAIVARFEALKRGRRIGDAGKKKQ